MWRKASYVRSASFAAISTLPAILGCALLGATGVNAATCAANPCDPYVVTFQQDGSNIVATGTGEFDRTGLINTSGNFGIIVQAQLAPQPGQLLFGSVSGLPGFDVSGPTINGTTPIPLTQSFNLPGIGVTTPVTQPISTNNGPTIVGINGGIPGFSSQGFLSLSPNYVSGTVITNQATFAAASLSCVMPIGSACNGLGVNPDQVFKWTWGNGDPDQSFTINTTLLAPPSEIPAPAALPLFGTGLGALGLLGWRRKRKARTIV